MAIRVGRSIFALRTNATINPPAPPAVHGLSLVLVRIAGSESLTLGACPCCASAELEHTWFVTPTGFAPDINEKREVDRGQSIVYAGITERAQLEVQEVAPKWDAELFEGRLKVWTGPQMLAMVNKGVKNRGFRVCPDCGRAEPEYGPGFTDTKLMKGGAPVQHTSPLERGVVCMGVADGPFLPRSPLPDRRFADAD